MCTQRGVVTLVSYLLSVAPMMPHDDDVYSRNAKKTLLGVGLAALLGELAPRKAGSVEPSVVVAGEVCRDTIVTSRAGRTTDLVRSASRKVTLLRRPSVLVILALALAGSIAVGFGMRSELSERRTSASSVSAATSTSRTAQATAPVKATTHAATPPPTPTPAAVTTQPAAMPSATSSVRRVDFGDGSCAMLIDAKLGGEVSVDGQSVGPTPVHVNGLWCGRQTNVVINRAGYQRWSRLVITQEGRTSRLMATLRRRPPQTVGTFEPFIEKQTIDPSSPDAWLSREQ